MRSIGMFGDPSKGAGEAPPDRHPVSGVGLADRRSVLAGFGAVAAAPLLAGAAPPRTFPTGFLWGASTAGHQIEGNNVAADLWLLENVKPTVFAERSGDATGSLELWPKDLDLVRSLGLNSYRFSLEWSRIEPEKGAFSQAMLDHYEAIVAGCRERGIAPVVTFHHFTAPRWFAAEGGWTNPDSPALFARFCERAARRFGAQIAYAITINQPNTPQLIRTAFPPAMRATQKEMLQAAARAAGSERFSTFMFFDEPDYAPIMANLLAAHAAARHAIKSVAPRLPVGLSLSLTDEQAVGTDSLQAKMREERYGAWLRAARGDDFVGVQNYGRSRWDAKGQVAAPAGGPRNYMGHEVHAPSLAGAVRYAHAASGLPILVSEHGVGTDDDTIRAELIPAALRKLHEVVAEGVPVLGYMHWSLLDNFEWLFGYRPRFGLVATDRTTFARTPKPSASVYRQIALGNAV